MDRSHAFAFGFLSCRPHDGDIVDRLVTRKGQHILRGGYAPLYPHDIKVGVSSAEQGDEGRRFAQMITSLEERENDNSQILQVMQSQIKAILDNESVAIHSMVPVGIDLAGGLVVPTIHCQLGELDDILMMGITGTDIVHDDVDRRDPSSATLKSLSTWAKSQGSLLRMRSDTGVLMDPILHALLDEASIDKLMTILRKQPRPSGGVISGEWDRSHFLGHDLKIDDRIEAIRVSWGRIHATVRLAHGVTWISAPWSTRLPGIRLDVLVPESLIGSLIGRRLVSVIEHPLINPSWNIAQVQNNDAIPLDAHRHLGTDCAFVPLGAR